MYVNFLILHVSDSVTTIIMIIISQLVYTDCKVYVHLVYESYMQSCSFKLFVAHARCSYISGDLLTSVCHPGN